MKALAQGIWGTAHWTLELIGRGATWAFPTKRNLTEDEVYDMIGGAAVGVITGAILGLVLSEESHAMSSVTGAVIGGLVGICTGMLSGAIIQTVDDAIQEWLNSVNPK